VKLFIFHYQFFPSRRSAAGYAEFRPVAENTSVDSRARNRSVDIVILNPVVSEMMPSG
jgi:chemotaxis protein MotB